MMIDLSAFSEEEFDAKRWINAAVEARHPHDTIDKLLLDLEMKLLLMCEEIASSLDEQSSAAILRVPRATRDVIRLRDDAISLRSSVSSILLMLKQAEGSAAESIAALAKVDIVKHRMEAAYETLQDAAGLTQMSSTVEDVFASGDLPRAAETLANMRYCLSAVGEVAEFANVRKQLEVLEDRLDAMVQPRLTDALSNRKVEVAQEMRGILVRIGRFKSLEVYYSKFHLKHVKKLWDEFESRQRSNNLAPENFDGERLASTPESQTNSEASSFSSWLPSFYDELLLYLEQEWKWCAIAFPEDYKTLVPKLLIELTLVINSSFVSRINLATGVSDMSSGDMPRSIKIKAEHLNAMIELHNTTNTFARNIQHLFSECEIRGLLDVLKAVYSPYETFKQRYGQMERATLTSDIGKLDLRGAVTRGVGAQGIELSETVRRMEESIPQVILLLEAAIERCINFTGLSEADDLILALDDIMVQYISTLNETLKSLRLVCGVDNHSSRKPDPVSNEEEWSMVQGALQILTVADCLTSRCSVFEASLRSTLARLSTSLSLLDALRPSLGQTPGQTFGDDGNGNLSFYGRSVALDMATVRLVDASEKARKLFNLLEQSKDPRFHALPIASQRVATFTDTVNELVYDVLISKVGQRLSDVSRMAAWSSVEEPSAFPLPTFSAYPQSYVTSVGEYLLTLPQQLEPLTDGISGDDANAADEAQFFATEWVFKVAEGAAAIYIEQLRGIHYISDRGAQQLSVDIEYLSNVLSALSVPIPIVLSTFQTCLSTPRDQLPSLIKSEASVHLDIPTANLICKMRRVNLEQ